MFKYTLLFVALIASIYAQDTCDAKVKSCCEKTTSCEGRNCVQIINKLTSLCQQHKFANDLRSLGFFCDC